MHGYINLEGAYSIRSRKDKWRPPLQSAWASLVPKIAGHGLQILFFQKLFSLSSLGIKEQSWAHFEANSQGQQVDHITLSPKCD